MNETRYSNLIAYGLVIGLVIGLILDMYQINVFGEPGLAVVFMPVIGLLAGAIFSALSSKRSETE
ncbi:hypothetical protein tloyanaT_15470 [Thalassotalea loyana]|uniref:AtpZ/AtpI family protein n=1 Tax=Thalassotalea loyana TaxID=280483 RepID=A0ABQ6HCT5_9GAMM|nr:hypothetical protein [Thalassotalea loyana]GLX85295.1 hypothetical protein tloyanaT_15470 [Thalassotalea loyana]